MSLKASESMAVGGRVSRVLVMMSLTRFASRSISDVRWTSSRVTIPTSAPISTTGKPRCLVEYMSRITSGTGMSGATVTRFGDITSFTATSLRRRVVRSAMNSWSAPT